MLSSRGEVWIADMDPVRGHEQAGTRPVLVLSVDQMNHGPSNMMIVVPFSRTFRNNPAHVRVSPPEGGLTHVSYAMADQVRTISRERLGRRLGRVAEPTIHRVLLPLTLLLGLDQM